MTKKASSNGRKKPDSVPPAPAPVVTRAEKKAEADRILKAAKQAEKAAKQAAKATAGKGTVIPVSPAPAPTEPTARDKTANARRGEFAATAKSKLTLAVDGLTKAVELASAFDPSVFTEDNYQQADLAWTYAFHGTNALADLCDCIDVVQHFDDGTTKKRKPGQQQTPA